MKIKTQKQAKAIIGNIAGQHIPNQLKKNEIKLFLGTTIQSIGSRHYVQGCYYKEITRQGFVDNYGNLWTWAELFADEFNGQIEDKFSEV